MSKPKIDFGAKVQIGKKYTRFRDGYKKKYVPIQVAANGIFLGYRTITNGKVVPDYDGHYWVAEEHVKAGLVSTGPNLNPVYVPLDAIKVEQHK